jgi:molybdopterin-guanine dinucleotide biosynthesis protein A
MPTEPQGGSSVGTERVPVYILAGGVSRRFGSDKARALHNGVPLLVGVASALEPVADTTTVIAARDGVYEDLGFRSIGDVVACKGPLGGLLTALADCGGDGWLFLCACDWVGLRSEWARVLMGARTRGAHAVAYRTVRYEPLFALYHTSIQPAVGQALGAGKLAMQELLLRARTVGLTPPEDWDAATNLNRPLDDKSGRK